MKKILLPLLLMICFVSLAQEKHAICKTDAILEKALSENKIFQEQYDKTIAYLNEHHITQYKTVVVGGITEYQVPVIVHVIHTGGTLGSNYNPTDASINNFITHLNDGFSNNLDDPSISGTFNSVSLPIKFYLAQRNELASCSATTGINRIDNSSNSTYVLSGVGSPGITDANLKSIVHWNDLDYYNIYIVNKLDGEDGYTTVGTYTAGYAYFPVLGGSKSDGMVVLAYELNYPSTTFIHEMGHGFNLYHPFQGGGSGICPPISGSGCTVDNDKVCDTDPIQLDFTCNPTGANPCGGLFSSQTTQFNYMAYNGCTDRFTLGQSTRVNDALNLIRTGYKNTAGLDLPPTSLPTNITAPTYTSTNLNNSYDMGPSYVNLNSIEYTSSGYSFEGAGYKYYVDHTCNQSTMLVKNTTYPISVKTKTNAQNVKVYIDYNNDGTFGTTAPEMVFASTGPNGNYTHSGNITVPTSGIAFNVPLRMRVIADQATISPTMQLSYGQAEDYTINILQAPLPITWKNFTATLTKNNQVDIQWSTEQEFSNDYFEVEHSTDGIHFLPIHKEDVEGDKSAPTYYSYIDKNPFDGQNFYRIKQVDIDGQSSYSKTILITLGIDNKEINVTLFPNPVNDVLTINYATNKISYIEYTIQDINGKTLLSNKVVSSKINNTYDVDTHSLSSGIYIVKLKTNQGTIVRKLIKNN